MQEKVVDVLIKKFLWVTMQIILSKAAPVRMLIWKRETIKQLSLFTTVREHSLLQFSNHNDNT